MSSAYEQAGVSIDAGQQAVTLMKDAVKATHGPAVLAGIGAFGGMFDLGNLPQNPALVASTDGVGTKVKLAAQAHSYRTVGHDIVNHCVNDIMCAGEGVKPLFFLDYVASSQLQPDMIAEVVTGMAEACQAVGCALLGGETAEMPGVYTTGAFDVVGTIVGVLDKTRVYPRPELKAGDVLLGLPSSGPHTNGYSLIRQIFKDIPLDTVIDSVGELGKALLAPHRCYANALTALAPPPLALAHITGGGLIDNMPRVLPEGLGVHIDTTAWDVPPLYREMQKRGNLNPYEMYRVFNMGIGMVIIIAAEHHSEALAQLPEAIHIGEVVQGADFTLTGV